MQCTSAHLIDRSGDGDCAVAKTDGARVGQDFDEAAMEQRLKDDFLSEEQDEEPPPPPPPPSPPPCAAQATARTRMR